MGSKYPVLKPDLIKSFKPIVDKNSKALILGTMPGRESLEKQQYYAYKRNHFWQLIFGLFDQKPSEEYIEKVKFLLDHNIAVWDVIYRCEREGSLDGDIMNEEVNDLEKLFRDYPKIKYVFFNSTTAEKLFNRHVKKHLHVELKYKRLPSSSPAYTIPFDEKFKKWFQIREALESTK